MIWIDFTNDYSDIQNMYYSYTIGASLLISAYSEPFLYVVYFNSLQGITVPADKNETR